VDRRRKRAVAIGAVAALAVAGGGVAYAAATATDQRDAVLRDAAQRLNVSPDQLRAALQGAFGDQLDQAVKDGRLTQQQADRIKQRIRDGGVPLGGPLGGPGGPGFGHGPMGGPGPFGVGLDAAATYLGLTRAALGRQLRSGKTLAQVASAQGKSVSGLESALVDATRSALDRAVSSGRLTSAQRDDILRGIQQHVADLVNGTGPRMGFRRGGPGGPGGRPPWGGPPGSPGNP
jgi:hypothetical protein